MSPSLPVSRLIVLAKIASDWNKPNGLFVITPDQVDDFIFDLSVKKIHGVGRVTAGKLHKKGINTCGQLRQYSILELSRWFGSFGERLWSFPGGVMIVRFRPVDAGNRCLWNTRMIRI